MEMFEAQEKVESFAEENNLEGDVEYRLMDLVSEVGEVVKDATKSAGYGKNREDLHVEDDEIGDVLFSLFMACNKLDIDAEKAFENAMEKYRARIEEKGDPGSK